MKISLTFMHTAAAALVLAAATAPGRADILYVGNDANNTIERFSSTGSDLGVFASNPTADGAFTLGLAFDSAANLYVTYPNITTNVVKYSPTGTYLFSFGVLSYVEGDTFGRDGNLYIAETVYNKIEKFSPGGTDLGAFASGSGVNAPRGIAFDAAGNLYVVNSGNNTVEKFSTNGTDLGVFAGPPLNVPYGLAFDAAGNLFVSNLNSWDIEEFSPAGTFLGTFAHGNIFVSSGMGVPYGLAFDSAGNLYAANSNSSIEMFSPTGTDLGHFATDSNGPRYIAFTDDSGKPLPLPPGIAAATVQINIVAPYLSGQVHLRVTGAPGTNYAVQFATNLDPATVSWVSLFTSNSATGTFDYSDLHATNPVGFYRAVSQ